MNVGKLSLDIILLNQMTLSNRQRQGTKGDGRIGRLQGPQMESHEFKTQPSQINDLQN